MRISFLMVLLVISGFSSFAQKKGVVDSSRVKLQKEVYKTALKYGDLAVAKNAVYELLVLNPADKTLRDSLLYLYFNGGSFGQSVLVAREILAEDPSKSTVLEIKAVAEQNLGLIKESLESYEKLFSQGKNIYHQYQIAVLQYQLKRFGECNANLEEILKNEKSSSEKVTISVGQQESQQVVLKAAALNIRGVLLMETNKTDLAKSNFQEAVKIQPDFVLAKNNLNLIESKNKPAVKKAPGK